MVELFSCSLHSLSNVSQCEQSDLIGQSGGLGQY